MKTKDGFEVKLGDTLFSVYTDIDMVELHKSILDEDLLEWVNEFYKLKENAIKEAEEYFDNLIETLKQRKDSLRK